MRSLALICSLLISFAVQATHIVGGDIYYKKLSKNVYEVTLKLYMDCFNGSERAIQDDASAYITIWDAQTNARIMSHLVARTGPKYLDKVHYKCVVPEKDVCVSEYVYTKVMTIDPGKNGVILAFERCCRNNTIDNIVTPESTGATYWVKIPGTDIVDDNSSAVFKELPPNYLCTDAPLVFDHSAVDPDGDSLIYELYKPYQGASRFLPRPNGQPAVGSAGGFFNPPPFQHIYWSSNYSNSYQVAGDPTLEIDRFTGQLTLLPNKPGQYVIGIKVLEYRDGEFIGETLRDYQFNVRRCKTNLVTNFHIDAGSSALTFSCTDSVNFINKSQKAAHYFWDFGDPTTTRDTSSEEHPSWVYPGNGDYIAKLTAWNEICIDTFKFIVRIRSHVNVDLGPDVVFCEEVNRYLSPRIFDATDIIWNTGQRTSSIQVKDTGLYVATVYYDQCKGSDSVHIGQNPVVFGVTPDTLFCTEEEVDAILEVKSDANDLKYRWNTSFKDTLSSIHVTKSGLYWVRVNNANCRKVDSTRITVAKPEIGEYLFVCNEFEKEIDGGSYDTSVKYLWSNGATTRFNIITTAGQHWVQVTYKHCVTRDTLFVENPVIKLDLGPDSNYCDSLYRVFVAPDNMFSYLWQDQSTDNRFTTREPGEYHVTVVDTNGCDKSDTVLLTMSLSPELNLGFDTTICKNSPIDIGTSLKLDRYRWNTGESTPIISVKDSGVYTLLVIDSSGCFDTDSIKIAVDENALPNELFIANAFSPNGDDLNESWPFSEDIPQPDYRVRVYDRWGAKVFDSDSGTQKWDGNINDKPAENEAFIYLIEYRACNGERKIVKGTTTLMR